MSKFLILNHKMNLEYDGVYPYINELNNISSAHNIIVCPSNLYLIDFINHCNWGVGAQNVHEKKCGNYTGEVSSLQLKSMGIEYSIVGHYERKKYFQETKEQVREKLEACLDSNISPILCFGETGQDKDILNDLDILLEKITNIDFIIFAYEPLGADVELEIEEIQEQVEMVYHYLYEKYQSKPNIVYGGGVCHKDACRLLDCEYLNGLMLGGVSSNIDEVKKVLEEIKS